jgi:hypothetical protein
MVPYNLKGFTFYSVRPYEWALGRSIHLDSSAFIHEQRNPERRGNFLMFPTRFRTAIPAEEIAQINGRHSFLEEFYFCFPGMRFGLMQTKVGLVSLLSKYQFSVSKSEHSES